MKCPGSIRLAEGMPDESTSYAIEGTAAHDLAERCLRKNLSPDALEGMVVSVGDEFLEVTDEMAFAVQTYVSYVRERVAAATTAKLLVETKFDLDALDPPAPMFGTSDVCIWNENARHLEVVDYKHGMGVPVDVVGNPQLRYYALGAVLELRNREEMKKPPKKITLTIVQPRAPHSGGAIRSETITWAELKAFKKELMEHARATLADNAPLAAGSHCQFCKAQPRCPEQHANAVELAQSEFDVETVPPPAEMLSDEQLREVLVRAKIFEDWIRSVRQYVHNTIEQGTPFDGWKLVDKRATRKWANEDEATEWLISNTKTDEDALYSRKLKTPAQAEKDLLKGMKGPDGKKLKLPDELVDKTSSGYNLVPSSDPRPAATLGAADEFDALPPGDEEK
jgi:hypothetical protein